MIPFSVLLIFSALLGLVVGSFLNVVIYRLPKMMEAETDTFTLSRPASHCPRCKASIRWWQNIPLLSFIVLRGRCYYCHQAIAWCYPLVELLSALLSFLVVWYFGVTGQAAAALLFTWILLACFFIDLDHQLLPDSLTLPLLWLGLFFNLFHFFANLPDAVIGAMVGYGFFWLVYQGFKCVTGKEGLGYGDFKLLAALGAWLGWPFLLPIVIVSGILSILSAVILHLTGARDLRAPMPYGPSLVVAGFLALIYGPLGMQWYWFAVG